MKLHHSILILSGGYGLLLASEPIGRYEAVLRPAWWPNGLLQDAIAAYAVRHRLRTARSLVSASTAYRRVLDRVDWKDAGIEDALVLSPNCDPRGAMVKAPRAQGEALARLLEGGLPRGWRSSDNVTMTALRPPNH